MMAVMFLAPWPVAYAYDSAGGNNMPLDIQPAELSAVPEINAYGNAIGHVKPGDLFTVDMTGSPADVSFSLMITNADELAPDFRFMNMKVGIYVQADGGEGWELLKASDGTELPGIYITMHTGIADFTLPGGARYRITIETGCFYCYGVRDGDGIATPKFYLTGA